MATDSFVVIDYENRLQSGLQISGRNRISLDLFWFEGARWSQNDFLLDKIFDMKKLDKHVGFLDLEAETSIAALLEYIGHSFDEALVKHSKLKWCFEHSVEKDDPTVYNIDGIRGFWNILAEEERAGNHMSKVRVIVMEVN